MRLKIPEPPSEIEQLRADLRAANETIKQLRADLDQAHDEIASLERQNIEDCTVPIANGNLSRYLSK